MTDVLAQRDRALDPDETEQLLRERLGDEAVVGSTVEYGVFTLRLAQTHWVDAARLCRDDRQLAYDLFDCLFGIDARDEGFDVVAVLYSTSTGNRIALRTRCDGGRDAPTCPSLTDVYHGANWMERETWDMFGVDFTGHPGLAPRLLTVENFEGWPLRKDFHLASRVAKPWPGVKEPAELDDEGNVIERVPRLGDAPGPYDLDKALAEQAKLANPDLTQELDEPGDTAAAEASGDAAGADAGGDTTPEPATEIDQEVYDQLIAEGKSERIARSKAKAAWLKKQRARERAEASGGGEPGDAAASGAAEASTGEAADAGDGDPEAAARERADARRREQAEARRRRAEERAAEASGSEAADADRGEAANGEAGDGEAAGGAAPEEQGP